MLYIVDIVQLLDPVKEMMQTELARKLTSTDAVLKDSISKLVRSKVMLALLLSQFCSDPKRYWTNAYKTETHFPTIKVSIEDRPELLDSKFDIAGGRQIGR